MDRLSVQPCRGFHPTARGCSVQLPRLCSASGVLRALLPFPPIARGSRGKGLQQLSVLTSTLHARLHLT